MSALGGHPHTLAEEEGPMRAITKLALSAAALAVPCILPTVAQAQDDWGMERPRTPSRVEQRVAAEAFGGSGIGGRYGAAYGARVGYTTAQGIWLGAEGTRYQGAQGSSDIVIGGDVGMRFFPASRFEVRPHALIGANIRDAGDMVGGPSGTTLAIQPGLFAGYHLGAAYLGAEGRVQIVPTPAAAAVLGTAGLTF